MTNQEKLEAFAPYLPYEVKCQMEGETTYDGYPIVSTLHRLEKAGGIIWVSSHDDSNDYYCTTFIEEFYPILHPLSDLTKPCLENDKVPLLELAKMAYHSDAWFLNNDMAANGKLHFNFDDMSFWLENSWGETVLFNQLQLFQQLYKWHFWLGDQSEFGKSIIDINTLNK